MPSKLEVALVRSGGYVLKVMQAQLVVGVELVIGRLVGAVGNVRDRARRAIQDMCNVSNRV